MLANADVVVSRQDSDVLNLGTGSVSWWEVNGAGCKPTYPTNLTSEVDPDPSRPLRPERVTGCFLHYQYVEVLHAALQCVLAVSWVLDTSFWGKDNLLLRKPHRKRSKHR